jgi:non-canonical purine NTP pyrophosphatase (RdgB/HAM1 family)
MTVTFITGNENKARVLEQYLGYPVSHQKIDLDEIQSLELNEIIEHKVRQAFDILKSPVLVEDVSLVIEGMGALPGPFIKWFVESMGLRKVCQMVNSFDNRNAKAQIAFGYYDGQQFKIFRGEVLGQISQQPRGDDSFGWNPIFIPSGTSKTYAEMDGDETLKFSLRTTTVFPEIKEFLSALDSG